ncbi:DegT/DnrJ/EryC1/StrS family aminotransferase [Nocardiopsis potens]|uniref:DegT/DnrJ/EryC1/StrS family aminotransferase n=1 Tax=Nocardiopsis potens TaxID=1246458 RepID=UPI00034CEA42|nr:DegT/DnrJ/EryC1/StrS family aminotransferase [Nocardiopsis potens]
MSLADDPRRWPRWPELGPGAHQHLSAALLGGRLACSGARSPWPSRGAEAARALAEASGRRSAVLTANGSGAIVVALQALGIGPGDTVAMPATTWVGCATAVLRTGAAPVFFDASPDSPCRGAEHLPEAPSAVLAVHLYAQHADIAAVRAALPGVPIVEDASHAQLARSAGGAPIGSLGEVSVMSFQETKVLTCGEGRAALTCDDDLVARLAALTADSRRPASRPGEADRTALEASPAPVHGANHALAETGAALLLDQLERFPGQAAARSVGAAAFLAELAAGRESGREAGWEPLADAAALASGAFYGLLLRPTGPAPPPRELIARVRREAGVTLEEVYPPVPEGPLYRPETVPGYAAALSGRPRPPLPESRRLHETAIVVPHHAFLAGADALRGLAAALRGAVSDPSGPARTARPARPLPGPAPRPVVDVVTLTRGRRPEGLARALNSAAAQRTGAEVRLTVWIDAHLGAPAALPGGLPPGVRAVSVGGDGFLPEAAVERVGALRRMAVQAADGDLIAFLDDDNEWEPDHLESLLEAVAPGLPAAHSWRRLVGPGGGPHPADRFPWLPPGPAGGAPAGRAGPARGDGAGRPRGARPAQLAPGRGGGRHGRHGGVAVPPRARPDPGVPQGAQRPGGRRPARRGRHRPRAAGPAAGAGRLHRAAHPALPARRDVDAGVRRHRPGRGAAVTAAPEGGTARTVRTLLFDRSPYEGLPAGEIGYDPSGWDYDHPVFREEITRLRPSLIVEVGTWKGASALHMAGVVRDLGLDCEIVCVDTFLGSREHWLTPEWKAEMHLSFGRPGLYPQFLANVVHDGLTGVITPFPATSATAAAVLGHHGVRCDLVYIDAGHDLPDVARDLDLYWPLLRPGGTMIGDDFIARFPGVVQAVRDFAGARSLPLDVREEKWVLRRPPAG